MGIVRNPANTMRRGRVGETTYYISGGQQIARQALNGSNFGESARRSDAQQKRRVLWANLVNFYKASRGWMPKAFETKKRNQSDYNKFIQLNINSTKIALTKSEAEAGACVVSNFLVSQGSLPSIDISKVGDKWLTNIAAGSLVISGATTVGEFSEALLAANANIRRGMQLSFVSYQQSVDPMGTPRVISRCYEVTIDPSNTVMLFDSFPAFCAEVTNGFLGTSDNISIGGFAYILSEQTTSGLIVSTQQLVSNNGELVSRYSGTAQLRLSIDSYGVDNEVVLSPVGTISQSPEAQPLYIRYVEVGTDKVEAGKFVGPISVASTKVLHVFLSRPLSGEDEPLVELVSEDDETLASESVTVQGSQLIVRFDPITNTSPVVEIRVSNDSDGTSISFASERGIDDDL